jgi:MFS family permease
MAMNNVIISDIIPLRHRPMYLAVPQIAWAVGTITGPLIGGLFVEHATWRWVFYINFPFCAIGLAIIPFTVKLFAERPSVKERLMRMDWVGMFLFISSTTSFLIGITWGGVQYEWYSWQTLVPLFLGLVGLYLTCMWEIFVAPKPFLRFSLFNNRSANAAYVGSLLQGLLLFCTLYYIPIYFEAVKGFGPAQTGLAIIPATGALVPMSIVSGAIMRRLGKFRWAIWSGWAVTTLATGLMILLDVDIQNYGWILILITTGTGYGLLLMSLNYCIQVWTDSKEVAHAAVMYTFLRSFGICLGVTLGGTVFQNQLVAHLREMNLPADLAVDAISLIANLSKNPAKDIIAGIISKTVHNVAELMLGCAVFGGLLSLMIKSASTDKALESEHVLRTPSPDVDSLCSVEKGEFE